MSQPQVISAVKEAVPSVLSNPIATVLIGICILLSIYEYWFRSLNYFKMGYKIPGPTYLPIVGNAYVAIGRQPGDMMRFVWDIYKKLQSDVVRAFLGPKLIVGLADARDVELILGSNVHLEKSKEYRLFEPWLGDGLLISKGEKWRSHRKMIAPTFHSSILKSFIPVFNKNANALIESFKKEQGKTFDVHDYMSGTTVDTLLETAMGVKKTDEDNTGFEYAMSVMKMCNILHLRHYKLWLRPDFIFNLTKMSREQNYLLNIIHTLTRQVIKRKKENYFAREAKGEKSVYEKAVIASKYNEKEGQAEEISSFNYIRDDLDENDENDVGEKRRLAFLDFMIEASHAEGNKLSDDEIKEEVDTIMFEAEVYAIELYTRQLEQQHPRHKSIKIFSDSQAALKALGSYRCNSKTVWSCQEALTQLGKRNTLTLVWIPGHSGLEGNEIVDSLAREGATKGHDTTAAASSFVLSILGVHQDIQEKVFEELKEIFQDDFYRPITFNDTVQMKYLERVILETLRLYPPVPIIARVVNEDVKLVSGDYTIPAGTTVVIGTYAVHRNPKYYTNPEKFDPDNFLPERCQDRPYYAFIPFSAGPRSCVGRKYAMLKLKVLLASALRKFRTISIKDEKDFKLQGDIILKREDGFHIRVEERRV